MAKRYTNETEDLAELSREALLIVRYGRVEYANSAAQGLFASCAVPTRSSGRSWMPLGRGLGSVMQRGWVRRVRTRGTPVPQALDIRVGAAQLAMNPVHSVFG
jgi:hypothetical protein